MAIFSYQRSLPIGFFRLKGKIFVMVTVKLGKVKEIEESRFTWLTFIVPEIVNGLFGKRLVMLTDELVVLLLISPL